MFFDTLMKFMGREYAFVYTVATFAIAAIGLLITIFTIKNPKYKQLKIFLICLTSLIIIICAFSAISYIVYINSGDPNGRNDSSEAISDVSESSDSTISDPPPSAFKLYAQPSPYTDKWGYVDGDGTVVIPYIYDWADDFINGYAAVCKHNNWGFIDTSGNEVIPFDYDGAWSFINGLAPVFNDGFWGFIDEWNTVKIPFKYTNISRTYIGHEQVYLDENGEVIIYGDEMSNTNSMPDISASTNSSETVSDSTTVSSTRLIVVRDYLQPYVSATIDKSELHITISKEQADQRNKSNTYPFRWGVHLESNKANDYVIQLELCIDSDGSVIETNATTYIITSPNSMEQVQENFTKIQAYLDDDKYILSCNIANDYIPLDEMCINTLFHY